MNEAIFAAALAALLWSTVVFRDSQSGWAVLAAAAASNAASLTRYEGWFLIPFVALYILLTARRKSYALLFAVLAALGPLAWLAHNQYYYSNALEFYDGDFSAQAIYARRSGRRRGSAIPAIITGDQAIEYYFTAVTSDAGLDSGLCSSALGAAAALAKKIWWPLAASRASTGCFTCGACIPPACRCSSRRFGRSVGTTRVTLSPPCRWPHSPRPASWRFCRRSCTRSGPQRGFGGGNSWALAGAPLCWKESAVNSTACCDWTEQAAAYLAANLSAGDGIIFPSAI